MSKDKILEEIKKMSVLELSELVKDLEETFGVSAAAPVAVAAVAAPAAGTDAAAPAEEEKTDFTVNLKLLKQLGKLPHLGLEKPKS